MPAPVAAGFHPYFTVGTDLINAAELELPFESTLEYGPDMLPTGRALPVEGTGDDFRRARLIGSTQFNTCFLYPQRGADGSAVIALRDPESGRTVSISLGEAFSYVVLYSGDPLPESHRRRALAIEPMTCGSDGFNYPAWGLTALAPGEALSGHWQVSAQ